MSKTPSARTIVWYAAINMILVAAFATIFNFFPDKVGTLRSAADFQSFSPLLAPKFADHLPALNLLWGLAFSLNAALLATKRWTPALRWAQALLDLGGAYVLARLVFDNPFLTVAGSASMRYLLTVVALVLVFRGARRINRLVDGRWLMFGADPAIE